MRFHKNEDGPPCKHMENALQQVVDGTATGPKKLYAIAHAAQCTKCGNFLSRMKVVVETLRDKSTEEPPESAMSRLRSKIQELSDEQKHVG
jgi:hypothetical protein